MSNLEHHWNTFPAIDADDQRFVQIGDALEAIWDGIEWLGDLVQQLWEVT